jgi:hypothetical protein
MSLTLYARTTVTWRALARGTGSLLSSMWPSVLPGVVLMTATSVWSYHARSGVRHGQVEVPDRPDR